MQKVLVAPHMSVVSAAAMIIGAGTKTQGAVTKLEGALSGVPFMDLKKPEHFDQLSNGLKVELDKIPDQGGFPGQARKLVAETISTLHTMKRTLETAGVGTAANHAANGSGTARAGSTTSR